MSAVARRAVGASLFIILLASGFTWSQSLSSSQMELGISGGPMFFLGDLGGTRGIGRRFLKDLNPSLSHFSGGIYLGYYSLPWLGFRLAANAGLLEGDDRKAPHTGGAERFRLQRNLRFRTTIYELIAAMEFYPIAFAGKSEEELKAFQPYALVGAGFFHFNPRTDYGEPGQTKTWVELKPLRLEGQGMPEYPDRHPYRLTQPELVFGAGLKYFFSDKFFAGLDILHRKTFTDYIDDVSKNYIDPDFFESYLDPGKAALARQLAYRQISNAAQDNTDYINTQRGDPRDKDAFFSTVIVVGMKIRSPGFRYSKSYRKRDCHCYY